MKRKLPLFFAAVLAVAAAAIACSSSPAPKDRVKALEEVIPFKDARAQAVEFIDYYNSIKLTPEQERIKKAALSKIPAPCCAEFSIATCCCPCNLAKSVWGLSHYLIAKAGLGVDEVHRTAQDWMQFTNPDGYTGDACHKGGCKRPFHENGCGGMDEHHIL